MPLQIRRGTEAERIAMVPKLANGELLWITDAKKLYVGDGTTASSALAAVTGFNAEDAQDAAASLFTTSPTHSGISFAYDDIAGKLTATVNLSDYSGQIKADVFRGTLVADDSSILVDGVAGIIPADKVSGTFTGSVVGNLTGNTAGYHTGDVKGSVFADDSSLLVDAVDRIFFGTVDTGNTIFDTNSIVSSGVFSLGKTTDPIQLYGNLNDNFQLRQVIDNVNPLGYLSMTVNRGTLASPAAVQAGDELGGYVIKGYTNSSTVGIGGIISAIVDPSAVIAGGSFIKTSLIISAATDTSQNTADALQLTSAGVVTSNAFSATKYFKMPVYADDAARLAAIPTPAAGMMVFMTTGTSPAVANKAVVYDSTAWVALH